MITLKVFHRLRLDALDCTDFDAFVAEVGGSLPSSYYDDDQSAIDLLVKVWALRDLSIKVICKLKHMTLKELSHEYGIPLRTVENWSAGAAEPTAYILELIATDAINSYEDEIA